MPSLCWWLLVSLISGHLDLCLITGQLLYQASVREFAEAIRAYRVIFPDSDEQLTNLARDLVTK